MSDFIEDTPDRAHAFIQWKGTDVCMDFHCECGVHMHFDGDFAFVKSADLPFSWGQF